MYPKPVSLVGTAHRCLTFRYHTSRPDVLRLARGGRSPIATNHRDRRTAAVVWSRMIDGLAWAWFSGPERGAVDGNRCSSAANGLFVAEAGRSSARIVGAQVLCPRPYGLSPGEQAQPRPLL